MKIECHYISNNNKNVQLSYPALALKVTFFNQRPITNVLLLVFFHQRY